MSKSKTVFAPVLLAVALLAGCAAAPQSTSTPPQTNSAPPQSTSVAPSSAPSSSQAAETIPEPTTEADEKDVAAAVQALLARYADGTYPEPVIFQSDVGSMPPLPAGVAVPDADAPFTWAVEGSQMMGDVVVVTLPLGLNYELVATYTLREGIGDRPFDARILDLQQGGTLAEFDDPTLSLRSIDCSRLWISADIEALTLPDGMVVWGNAGWDESRSLLWLTLDLEDVDTPKYVDCAVEINGTSAEIQYRSGRYGDVYEFTDEEIQDAALTVHEALLTARRMVLEA